MSQHVFGPVPSRRLGRSLGVDLVPFKVCTYDCIYCQLGRTTCKTTERKEWVPLNEVCASLRDALDTKPDFITLSGSGEPTLFSRPGELIRSIKDLTDVPVAVLTNGSLLSVPEVRAGLLEADLVVPSLDAGNERLFRIVNRPHEDIAFDRMVEGLIAFRQEYGGRYWLEVLLLGGITAVPAEVERIAEIARRIGPDRVHLNTATRPPAEKSALAVQKAELQRLAAAFGGTATVVADYPATARQGEFAARREDVLNLLRRRPCTVDDIAGGLGLHRNEVVKYVQELVDERLLSASTSDGRVYYAATGQGLDPDGP